MLCAVEESYIMDEFNLKGLNKYVNFFKEAIFRILDLEQSGKVQITNELDLE
jgi:hypothetical protein